MKKARTKKKIFNIKTGKQLALINAIIALIIMTILYFVLPFILNYPPNSINNDFQVQIVGIKYTHQFIILATIIIVLIYVSLRILYRRLSIGKNLDGKDKAYILNIRRKCFTYPYMMLLLQSFVPSIICCILLIVFKTNFELLLRICIVIFSFSSVFSIISYMIGKGFFEEELIKTAETSGNKQEGMRINMNMKLLIQTLPLFLYSFVILLLLSVTIMTTEKGDLLFHFYHQELIKEFPDNQLYDLEDVKNKLETFDLKSNNDHIIMFSAQDGTVYYSPEPLNNFLINYALNYYDKMDGQIFEYYGQNSQAAVTKIHTSQGDYFVGIHFFVFGTNILVPFIIVAIGLILFNMLFILYIGKGLSNDIDNIAKGLDEISNSKNIAIANNLPITSNDEIGDLTLAFNNVQDVTKTYIEQIHDNQDKLMEKERLASLGQLIGGIAHNLKTPIMSISGAAEGLTDLIKEYDSSIDDPEVNSQDHHDIAKDMQEWIVKIKEYTEYMSDVITAVKGQAVTLSGDETVRFSIEELVKRVNILMRHELKNALIDLKVSMKVNPSLELNGDINSLVQVVNNMISNSIQSYNGEPQKVIELNIVKEDNNLVLEVKDYGCGMPEVVKDKLFKEMITTKGKNGTGLGLFMSYSNIRAHFDGTMTVDSKPGEGTCIKIVLPIR